MELLAQMIEEVSIVATHNVGRKKPRQIPRPDHIKHPRPRPAGDVTATVTDMDAYRKGIGVLAATTRRVVK